MLGKLLSGAEEVDFLDPNMENLVAQVSIEQPRRYGEGAKRLVVIDCGCKNGILRSLLARRRSGDRRAVGLAGGYARTPMAS